jgi:hypothetical protein
MSLLLLWQLNKDVVIWERGVSQGEGGYHREREGITGRGRVSQGEGGYHRWITV